MTSNRSTRYLPDGFRVLHEVRNRHVLRSSAVTEITFVEIEETIRGGCPGLSDASPSRVPRERNARGILMFLPERASPSASRAPIR